MVKKKEFTEFLDKHKNKLSYLIQLIFVVIIYGVLINFALSQFIKLDFSIKNILAIGIIAYLVKAELPKIIAASFPRTQQPPQF